MPQTSAGDIEAAQDAKTTMILGRAGVGPTAASGKSTAQQQVCLGVNVVVPLPDFLQFRDHQVHVGLGGQSQSAVISIDFKLPDSGRGRSLVA